MNKNPLSKEIKNCQICNSSNLKSILFIGNLPPVNQMIDIKSTSPEQVYFPLELVRCKECSHVQINRLIESKILFPDSYPYLTGTTKILIKNFYKLFLEARKIIGLKANDLIIDIGSNDGTLLENFKNFGCKVLGIEPTQASIEAKKKNIKTLVSYFNESTVDSILKKFERPKIITATNVFAHMEDPNKLVKLIAKMMNRDSVFISESHYLCSLIKTLQYDTVYHEHLRYYHLGALRILFEKNNLEIFHAKKIPTHGGSIRVYAARKNSYQKTPDLKKILREESKIGISNDEIYNSFTKKVINSKIKLLQLLVNLKLRKKKIFGIGAPSRASTLINYVGIDEDLVSCILEVKHSNKLNKFIPGTKIPVIDENIIFDNPPDYLLIFSWHINKELINIFRRKGYRGKFIIPLPKPKVI
tara:strand:- start:3997 stop:5244 length:1248 start_codon:yes stop_codon:yes gene_type:complete